MRTIPPEALLGLTILAVCAGLAAINPALRTADMTERVSDGHWTHAFGVKFDEKLAIREASVDFWTAASYLLFREGKSGVLVGDEGWLYSSEEFDTKDPQAGVERTLEFAREADAKLKAQGVQLVVALIPAKARLYPEHLGRYHWPTRMQPVYGELKTRLTEAGIKVVDLQQPMLAAKADGAVFMHTDTHWSPLGSGAAAKALAAELAALRPDIAWGAAKWTAGQPRAKTHEGDLLNYLPLGPLKGMGPKPDHLVTPSLAKPEAEGLFAETDTPVLLVGTSYSQNPDWAFADQLGAAAGVDLVNAAESGRGPFAPLKEAIDTSTLADSGAKVVVWELPERYTWMSGELGPPGQPDAKSSLPEHLVKEH